MQLAQVAIVGAVNVGKSSLFNRLLKKKQAITFDRPGVTRDCNVAVWEFNHKPVYLIDTPGYQASLQNEDQDYDPLIQKSIESHMRTIIADSDCLVFVYDASVGLSQQDRQHLRYLYKLGKPILAVANKMDCASEESLADVHTVDAISYHKISATAKQGLLQLAEAIHSVIAEKISLLNVDTSGQKDISDNSIRFALLGKPNVGKSTLTNALVRKSVSVVSDTAGTTRDAMTVTFNWQDYDFTLVDTAGVRRRTKIRDAVEQSAVSQVLGIIHHEVNTCVYLIDAGETLSDQDFRLIRLVADARVRLIIAVNKIDLLDDNKKKSYLQQLQKQLFSHTYYPIILISAEKKISLHHLLQKVIELDKQTGVVNTSKLTRLLEDAIATHQPPMVRNRRIKPRIAFPHSQDPFGIVIQGKQVSQLPISYQQYLRKHFQNILSIDGIPLKLTLQDDFNPYKK